jgi:hypothetical protein
MRTPRPAVGNNRREHSDGVGSPGERSDTSSDFNAAFETIKTLNRYPLDSIDRNAALLYEAPVHVAIKPRETGLYRGASGFVHLAHLVIGGPA